MFSPYSSSWKVRRKKKRHCCGMIWSILLMDWDEKCGEPYLRLAQLTESKFAVNDDSSSWKKLVHVWLGLTLLFEFQRLIYPVTVTASSRREELSIKGSGKKKSDHRDVLFLWFVTLLGPRDRTTKRWHNPFYRSQENMHFLHLQSILITYLKLKECIHERLQI